MGIDTKHPIWMGLLFIFLWKIEQNTKIELKFATYLFEIIP
jgi:hypothetical protein